MIQNPIRTSSIGMINQGAGYGINTMNAMNIGTNQINQITTLPPAPMVNNIGGNFGLNQGFSQQNIITESIPATTVRRVRQ